MFDFCKATNKISQLEEDGLVNKRQLLIDKQNSKRHTVDATHVQCQYMFLKFS